MSINTITNTRTGVTGFTPSSTTTTFSLGGGTIDDGGTVVAFDAMEFDLTCDPTYDTCYKLYIIKNKDTNELTTQLDRTVLDGTSAPVFVPTNDNQKLYHQLASVLLKTDGTQQWELFLVNKTIPNTANKR